MKKILNIFTVIIANLILFISFILICDYFAYQIYVDFYKKNKVEIEKFEYKLVTKEKALEKEKKVFENRIRKPDGLQYRNKHSITIFGCSFAYGLLLEQNQTLGYKLSDILKAPVFNKSFPAGNLQQMWFQTGAEGAKTLNNIIPTDTYLYVMINDHYNRMYSFGTAYSWRRHLNYINKKGKLQNELQLSPLESYLRLSYTYRHLKNVQAARYLKNKKNKDEIINRAVLYITESKNKLQENSSTKINFIVFLYGNIKNEKELREKLNKNGIITISTSDLTKENLSDIKYTISDINEHPNENAWNLIAPLLAERIKKIWKERDYQNRN